MIKQYIIKNIIVLFIYSINIIECNNNIKNNLNNKKIINNNLIQIFNDKSIHNIKRTKRKIIQNEFINNENNNKFNEETNNILNIIKRDVNNIKNNFINDKIKLKLNEFNNDEEVDNEIDRLVLLKRKKRGFSDSQNTEEKEEVDRIKNELQGISREDDKEDIKLKMELGQKYDESFKKLLNLDGIHLDESIIQQLNQSLVDMFTETMKETMEKDTVVKNITTFGTAIKAFQINFKIKLTEWFEQINKDLPEVLFEENQHKLAPNESKATYKETVKNKCIILRRALRSYINFNYKRMEYEFLNSVVKLNESVPTVAPMPKKKQSWDDMSEETKMANIKRMNELKKQLQEIQNKHMFNKAKMSKVRKVNEINNGPKIEEIIDRNENMNMNMLKRPNTNVYNTPVTVDLTKIYGSKFDNDM